MSMIKIKTLRFHIRQVMIMFLKMSVSRLIPIGSLVLWAETDEVKQPF